MRRLVPQLRDGRHQVKAGRVCPQRAADRSRHPDGALRTGAPCPVSHGSRHFFVIHSKISPVTIILLLWFAAAWPLRAATLVEDFSRDPRASDWRVHGATNLFSWNAGAQNLAVTWDSAQTNSYFLRPLGTVLATNDNFRVEFDLWLDDISIGVNPEQPFTFELALGFIRVASATNASLRRGAGVNPVSGPRNLVEFDYFPDSGFGATLWPALISSNGQFNYRDLGGNYVLAELATNQWYHVMMAYSATNRGLVTTVLTNGQIFATHSTRLTTNFNDFRLDAFAVCSYQDAGSDGSLLAHGRVDNVVITIPAPPLLALSGVLTDGLWQVTLPSRTNWLYALQRSEDFHSWTPLNSAWGNDGILTLTDSNSPAALGLYRVSADRP